MITVDPNSVCEQAKTYYYEYLCGEPRENVPTKIGVHIDKCGSCQAEVERLKVILTEGEEDTVKSTRQRTTALATNLRFHFAYMRASVGCDTVKLFLPSLAIPALEISVPTPITVHLDKCQQCASDLERIRQLKLTVNQLGRLGQLFAEESRVDANACAEAQKAIASVGAMAFENTSPAILKHLCVCSECRKLLYEDRNGRNEKLAENLKQSPIACDSISATDIFDYVVPYGIDPDRDQPAMSHRSSTSHLINCPRCLGEMQKLHETVYGILERQESGIVTCFKLDESARSSALDSPEDLYEGWPIEVQVFDKSLKTEAIDKNPVESVAVSPKLNLKRRLSTLKIRPFIKPATAAAAVILAALFLFNAPIARAVNLDQIYKALERITNVYIVTFHQEESNKTQEIWISRTLNTKMLKTKNECTLWDLNAKSEQTKNLITGSIVMTQLDDVVALNVKKTMKGSLGLLRYNSMPEAPEGANWLHVANEDIETAIPGTEVHDLVWTEKSLIGSIIHRKWRVYTDLERKLPKRIEWLMKLPDEKEYKLETITTISYPTEDDIQASINDEGF